jgi:hypothetical protein
MDTAVEGAGEKIFCEACYIKVHPNDQFCNNCGYPLKGSAEQQDAFKSKQVVDTVNMRDYQKKLANASNTLYFLSALFILVAGILFFKHEEDEAVLAYVLPSIILGVTFLLLATYTKKKPLACLICGFSLYIIVQALGAISDPATIASGIILKIIVVVFLINGIKSAVEVDRMRKENNLV